MKGSENRCNGDLANRDEGSAMSGRPLQVMGLANRT